MNDAFALETVLGRVGLGNLPWRQAWIATFAEFTERFTLHDSVWVGIFLGVGETNDAVLVIEWDAHWLPEPLRTECSADSSTSPTRGGPFLFVRISNLTSVALRNFNNSISTRSISHYVKWTPKTGPRD